MGSVEVFSCSNGGGFAMDRHGAGGRFLGNGDESRMNGSMDIDSPAIAELAQESNLKRRKFTALPLEVGARVLCRWRDEKYHPVRVIERRKLPTGPDDYQYYVHYTEFNRRLDE
eukprot:c12077_g1_i1 orf=135-476(+)